jgi:hypothetical protein
MLASIIEHFTPAMLKAPQSRAIPGGGSDGLTRGGFIRRIIRHQPDFSQQPTFAWRESPQIDPLACGVTAGLETRALTSMPEAAMYFTGISRHSTLDNCHAREVYPQLQLSNRVNREKTSGVRVVCGCATEISRFMGRQRRYLHVMARLHSS